jgi:hypothetical protein
VRRSGEPPQRPTAGAALTGGCDATFPGVIDASVDFNLDGCCDL